MTSSTAAVDGGELEEAVVLVEADAINLALLDSIEELAVEPSGRPGEEEVVWGLGSSRGSCCWEKGLATVGRLGIGKQEEVGVGWSDVLSGGSDGGLVVAGIGECWW